MIQQAKPYTGNNEIAGRAAARNPAVTMTLEGEFIRIVIPIKFKRKAGRKEIILPPGATAPAATAPPPAPAQDAIVTALVRAFKWQAMLDSGEADSIAVLAKRLNVETSYVRRILRLTCLAPDIIEALLEGSEPDGLSLRKLLQYRAILWTGQRAELGFPPQ